MERIVESKGSTRFEANKTETMVTIETTAETPLLKPVTDRKEVGQVWVMQAKRNKGAPGEGTEGHSVLGVLIENVSYLGFRILNDISDEAADYRLFCADNNGVLQTKGLIWRIISKVDEKNERPVTTLYIRVDVTASEVEADLPTSQSQVDVTVSKADADSQNSLSRVDVAVFKPDAGSLNPPSRVPTEYLYYVAKQKKVVTRAVPGKGMLNSKLPAFGVYQRYIADKSEDDSDSVK